ncbi:hypothetical protein ACFV0A_33765, partial [Streptomyces sp. NPDC059552]
RVARPADSSLPPRGAAGPGPPPQGEGAYGRAAHQAPETDGQVVFTDSTGLVPGRIVTAKVVGTLGVDLVAEPLGMDLEEAAG